MKTSTKLIIAGAAVGVVVAGVLIAKHFIHVEDFVINRGNDRYYIQSALNIADSGKKKQEIASLLRIPDSLKKWSLSRIA